MAEGQSPSGEEMQEEAARLEGVGDYVGVRFQQLKWSQPEPPDDRPPGDRNGQPHR